MKATLKKKTNEEVLDNNPLLGNCVKCGWEICCLPHFEEHVAEVHKNIN